MHARTHPRQKINLKAALTAAAVALSAGLFATHALAECDEDQEALAGKAIATAATGKIATLVPGSGKQMINIDSCEASASGLAAEFKFNVIGTDGLYWVTGTAKVAGKDVRELTFVRLSPNLAAASAAKGVKLAAN